MSGASTDSAEVAELFAAAGVPPGMVAATLARLGGTAGAELRADPWRLLAVDGVRPEQADHFAGRVLGRWTADDPRRDRALIEHLLARAAGDGHTALPAVTVAAALSSYGIADSARAVRAALDSGEVMIFEAPEPADADTGVDGGVGTDTDTAFDTDAEGDVDDRGMGAGDATGATESEGADASVAAATGPSAAAGTGAPAEVGPSLGLARIALAEESLAEGLQRLVATAEPLAAASAAGEIGPPDGPAGGVDGGADDRADDRADDGAASDPLVRAAVREIAGHGTCVADTGPAGGSQRNAGRLVRALAALAETNGLRLAVAAPTTRAARELTRVSGVPALALYELLEANPDGSRAEVGYRRGEQAPLEADIVVLSGAAAIGVEPAAALVDACADGTHLVLAGDPRELASFGPGRVLSDLVESGAAPVTDLSGLPAGGAAGNAADTAVDAGNTADAGASNAGGGDVLEKLARAVGGGDLPPVRSAKRAAVVVTARDAAEAAHRVVQLVTDSIPRAIGIAPEDIQVITPVRRGAAGADALNAALKARLNGPDTPGASRAGSPAGPADTGSGGTDGGTGATTGRMDGGATGGTDRTDRTDRDAAPGDSAARFAPGDRVLLTGGYPAAGIGETGLVTAVSAEEIEIDFAGARLTVPATRFGAIRHAWAMTVHRAHGSVWPAVVAVLPGEAAGTLSRPLVYTAFTRALVHLSVVHAAGPALAHAVRVSGPRPRRTRLAGLLDATASPWP